MKWTKNTKYIGFMDAYHAPFTPKHRYWVGLLFFALIIHNLVTSFSPNPYLPVISAGCLPVGIIAMRIRVYKIWWNEFAETLFLLNLIPSIGTLYTNIKTVNSTGYALAKIMCIALHLFSFSCACYWLPCRATPNYLGCTTLIIIFVQNICNTPVKA